MDGHKSDFWLGKFQLDVNFVQLSKKVNILFS